MRTIILSFATLSVLAFSPGLSATTYYVSPTGNDNNNGTQGAPFATIQRGVDLAQPGDTVSVANGTYGPAGHYTCGTQCSQSHYAAAVTLWNSGTASAAITIAAQNRWGAVLDCGLPYGYSGDGTDGVQACDTYFSFQGSASYITISGFDIQRSYWTGAMVNQSNSHISFVGNHFHNIGNRVYSVPAGTSSYGIEGVFAGTGASYITWDRNEFNNIGRLPHAGVTLNDDYSHDHGLYLFNGPYTITNNIFYGQAAGWNIQTAPSSHDITITNNTLIGGANPLKDGCMILWGLNTNVLISNNIFYNGRNYAIDNWAATLVGGSIQQNMIYGSPYGVISLGGITQWLNRLNTDPGFVSPGTNDYHLAPGGLAIDAGAAVPLTVDFDGNPRPLGFAYDIGAYEFVPGIVAPAAPNNLAAAPASTGGINLAWNNSSNSATFTLVEESTDNINFMQVMSLPGTATSWSTPTLNAGTLYYFRVRAQNSGGYSGYSNTANAVANGSNGLPWANGAPNAPSGVAAGQSSVSPRTQINVYWNDNSNNETGFAIFRSTDKMSFSQIATVGANVTQYDDPGLATNTRYFYYVEALGASGTSAPSNTDSTITQP